MAIDKNKDKKLKETPKALVNNELGYEAFRLADGRLYDETAPEFQWPRVITTVKRMKNDSTFTAAFNVIKAMIRNVKYDVKTPLEKGEKPTEVQKEREQFIKSCMKDMPSNQTWDTFMQQTLSSEEYGFALFEKIYKVCEGREGKVPSRFNDGKLRWAKLPIRSQDSILKWEYSSDGHTLTGVEQNTSMAYNLRQMSTDRNLNIPVTIPINKLLHFIRDSNYNNPEGISAFKSSHVDWKFKVTIAELEAIGLSRDMRGMPVFELPPDYLSADASDDKKAVFQYCKDVIKNLHNNEQMGLVQPKFIDPETKQNIFGFKLEGVVGNGGKSYDTDKMLNRYENKILMTFLADVLKMGQDSVGSFSLADNKSNLLSVQIQAILKDKLEVINNDLIPQTLALNGMLPEDGIYPEICHGDLDKRDLAVLGKFIQNVVAVKAMEVDEEFSDWLREEAGAPLVNRDKPLEKEMLSGGEEDDAPSRSGDGLTTNGTGTSTEPGGADTTDSNGDNK